MNKYSNSRNSAPLPNVEELLTPPIKENTQSEQSSNISISRMTLDIGEVLLKDKEQLERANWKVIDTEQGYDEKAQPTYTVTCKQENIEIKATATFNDPQINLLARSKQAYVLLHKIVSDITA